MARLGIGSRNRYRSRMSSEPVMVLRPRLMHWLPLLLPMSFFIVLGVMALAEGAILESMLGFAICVGIVGYNGLTKLTVDDRIAFSRYGWRLWQVEIAGAKVRSGSTGEIPIIPAFVIRSPAGARGAFPKAMLDPADIARLRAAIIAGGGEWPA